MNNTAEYKIKSAIFGHAIGDALGVSVEFESRESLEKNPVTDMREFGTHRQPKGTWSDDTSLTLAALDCLCDGLDYDKIMRAFDNWDKYAEYTATDVVFDIGIATSKALGRYAHNTEPLKCGGIGERDNGNGSLMRIIPFILYCHYKMRDADIAEKIDIIHNASSLTHRHVRSQMGCGIYAFVIFRLLNNPDKKEIIKGLSDAYRFYEKQKEFGSELSVYDKTFSIADIENSYEISSSGYIVHSLEAALWCVLNADSYSECVLKAVNLGDDTDTVAAIAGGIAGLMYGFDDIPDKWLSVLKKKSYIEDICKKFANICG